MPHTKRSAHVVLTSHPGQAQQSSLFPIHWGAKTAKERGPLIATNTNPLQRNVIGAHSGAYSVYRALAMAAGKLAEDFKPDLTNTEPVEKIGPHPQWFDPNKITSLDPWGADVASVFKKELKAGYDIRPTIAVTKAHIQMAELEELIRKGELEVDGKIVKKNHDVAVTKAAIENVWYLPKIAEQFGTTEGELRKTLFQETGGMFPELVTRHDLKAFMPPIGSTSVYIFGDVKAITDPKKELTVRVHDECNGSDVFGSDICTCRPYLIQGIEAAIKTAQKGGAGVIVYYRKEGRALGEVTKFLVYNARKRQKGGDSASTYFRRTECVAGVQDMRFQQLMPDVLHWLGITRITNFISMSNMKYDAIVNSGIKIINRVEIPMDRIPADASVEMEAKKAAGYFTPGTVKKKKELKKVKGRGLYE
jgi:GTP cyclohydrolase II